MTDATKDRRPEGPGNDGGGGMAQAAPGGGQDGRPDLKALLGELVGRALAKLMEALGPKLGAAGGGDRQEQETPAAEATAGGGEERAARPSTQRDERYPYAHGDVDLSSLPANVPTAEERRPRRGGARNYYFLPQDSGQERRQEDGGGGSGAAAQPLAKPG